MLCKIIPGSLEATNLAPSPWGAGEGVGARRGRRKELRLTMAITASDTLVRRRRKWRNNEYQGQLAASAARINAGYYYKLGDDAAFNDEDFLCWTPIPRIIWHTLVYDMLNYGTLGAMISLLIVLLQEKTVILPVHMCPKSINLNVVFFVLYMCIQPCLPTCRTIRLSLLRSLTNPGRTAAAGARLPASPGPGSGAKPEWEGSAPPA